MNSLNCFQLNFTLLPPPARCTLSHLCFGASPLLENNPTITNRSSPSSAPKFTLAVRLSSAVKGARGGQTRSEIHSMLNVVYTQSWNYLSVWVEMGAERYYSNHLGWCQRNTNLPVFSSPGFSACFWDALSKCRPRRRSKKLLWGCYHGIYRQYRSVYVCLFNSSEYNNVCLCQCNNWRLNCRWTL